MGNDAQAAWERRDLTTCVEILNRMNRLCPGDTAILIQLGKLYGLQFDYEQARLHFEKAVRLSPPGKRADALAKAGQHARDFANTELAERYLTMAVQERDATPAMFVKLAEFCERRRRMDEARDLVDRALKLDPMSPHATFAHAHLLFRNGDLDSAEQHLANLIARSSDPEIQIKSYYERGAILDRQGRFDDAMSAFESAKTLLKSTGAVHLRKRQGVLREVVRMTSDVSALHLKRWRDCESSLQPGYRLALLGGHPRSGTTLLEQVVDSHPDIVSAEETEHFSDYVGWPIQRRLPPLTPIVEFLEAAPLELLRKCRAEYIAASERYLSAPLNGRMLIDKNPSLTMRVPDLVRAFPEIRFLIALRDPRDVVLSCYMQPFLPIHEVSSSFLTLETAVDEYSCLMGVWCSVAPKLANPHLEVRYEDMVEDLEPVARRVLDFFGVPWNDTVLGFAEHASKKRVRSPTYADVTQKIFTRARGRWRNYQRYLEPYLQRLEPFVKRFGYD